jgi:hypothetical protein
MATIFAVPVEEDLPREGFHREIVFIFLLFAKKEVIRYNRTISIILYMRKTPDNLQQTPALEWLTSIRYSIDQMRQHYADNAMALALLENIVSKAAEVPSSVQATVAELLRANLGAHINNISTITAVVMAMDPAHTIAQQKMMTNMVNPNTEAANDEKFQMAA